MKTDTSERIIAYIKSKKEARAKEIIDFLDFSPVAVFKQLKNLQLAKLIAKHGKPPLVFYYLTPANMAEYNSALANKGQQWALSGDSQLLTPEEWFPTRDVFQARLDHALKQLLGATSGENLAYLLLAAAGEIGNNSFDHNLGAWRDTAGVFFAIDIASKTIVLADRGQGVFATIKRVRPNVESDEEALRIAFTETISGRAPEKRGNGLKFVSKVIQENNLSLFFYSGHSSCAINSNGMKIKKEGAVVPGTLAIIKF